MPGILRPPPNPLDVVDAVGDVVMQVPKLPAEILQHVGSAISQGGAQLRSAVGNVTDTPGDVPPDPVTFVAGAGDYIISAIKGVIGTAKGAVEGVETTLDGAASRIRRLVR